MPRFTLKDLFVAVTIFAGISAMIGHWLAFPESPDDLLYAAMLSGLMGGFLFSEGGILIGLVLGEAVIFFGISLGPQDPSGLTPVGIPSSMAIILLPVVLCAYLGKVLRRKLYRT